MILLQAMSFVGDVTESSQVVGRQCEGAFCREFCVHGNRQELCICGGSCENSRYRHVVHVPRLAGSGRVPTRLVLIIFRLGFQYLRKTLSATLPDSTISRVMSEQDQSPD